MASDDRCVAVVMVGGASTSNFNALGSDRPAPLFPVAGRPLLDYPIRAAAAVPGLTAIYVIGFYEERAFEQYLTSMSAELGVPVRYLWEFRGHGSAGGLHQFRSVILADQPTSVFVLYSDVCCTWPLTDLLAAHKRHPGALGTMLVKRVAAAKACECGDVVADPATNELLHYTERPETYVSDLVNTGVYVFHPGQLFDAIGNCVVEKAHSASIRSSLDAHPKQARASMCPPEQYVRMDGDILTPHAGKKALFVHETSGFWEQIKSPGATLKATELYLGWFQSTQPERLLPEASAEGMTRVVGAVYMHPSAKVDPSAKVGPNVSIGAHVCVGPGARLMSCTLLDDAVVGDHSVVSHAIIGWKSELGSWSRVQGTGDAGHKMGGVAILGEHVLVGDEVVVVNCIVLPHKEIKASVKEEIIL